MAQLDYDNMKQRHQFLQFVKIGEMEDYKILGVGSQDIAIEYSATTNTYKWVTMKNGKAVTSGYEMTSGIEQFVHSDDPIFKVIDDLRRELATSKAVGTILNVALYLQEEERPTSASADEQDISIEFNTFGGSSEDPLTIGYTINYNGDPRKGVATLDYEEKTATFVKSNEGEV